MDKKQLVVVVAVSVIVSFIGGALSASIFGGGAAAGSTKVGELVVVNDQGDPVISLNCDEVGPRIEMYDNAGQQRLFLNADAINTVMNLYGTTANAKVELGSYGQSSRLDMRDDTGRLIWRSL